MPFAALLACAHSESNSSNPPETTPRPAAIEVLPASFAADAGASNEVQAECDLEGNLAHFVTEYTNAVVVKQGSPSGRVLTMRIVNVIGAGGGMWSGPKQMTVEGTLTQNGATVGSFKARRSTSGGAFGGYKGTCSLLGRCAKAIGKDVASWLAAPSMDARLGEL